MSETIHCPKCGLDLPPERFYARRIKRKDGTVHVCRRSSCKKCCGRFQVAWDEKNRDKRRMYARRYHRKKNFGVDSVGYVEMLEQQSHACAICGITDTKRRLDIDHCHETEMLRGLLCTNCNNGLGRFKDNADFLRKAADYVEKHQLQFGLGRVFRGRFLAVM